MGHSYAGSACGRLQEGSGAVLGDELVVTNAHVVAGADSVEVIRHPDGAEIEATVVAFDPSADLAVLDVPGIDREHADAQGWRQPRGRGGRRRAGFPRVRKPSVSLTDVVPVTRRLRFEGLEDRSAEEE